VVLVVGLLLSSAPTHGDVRALWDLQAVRSEPLDVKVLEDKPGLDVTFPHRALHLTYLSQRWKGQDIRIEAFVVIPIRRDGRVPGVLSLHGHGGAGSLDDARNRAKEFKGVGMSISGPGQGKSTGRRDCTGHWIDCVDDPRDSFMYQYPYAAMRAITYLSSLDEVDPKRIGIIGGSMGAMCTIIVNGLDSRVAAAVPVSGSGSYEPEMRAGKTWFSRLILDALKVEADHPSVQAFLKNFDPIHYAPTQHGACLMVCGAQDEPFPITSLTRTFEKMPKHCRLTAVYDCNHGGFTGPNDEFKMYDNREQWGRRVFGTAHGWLHKHLDPPTSRRASPTVPNMPTLSLHVGKENTVRFRLDADASLPIVRVLLCWSLDGSYTFHKAVMDKRQPAVFELSVILHPAERDALCAFGEVEYPDNFFLTSVPHFGPTFDVQVRRTRFSEDVYRRELPTDQAIAEYKKALAAASGPVAERLERQYQLARFCAAAGRPDEAIRLFEDILQRDKELTNNVLIPNALYHQAAILYEQGQAERAIANLERAIRLYPSCDHLDSTEIPRARDLLNKIRSSSKPR